MLPHRLGRLFPYFRVAGNHPSGIWPTARTYPLAETLVVYPRPLAERRAEPRKKFEAVMSCFRPASKLLAVLEASKWSDSKLAYTIYTVIHGLSTLLWNKGNVVLESQSWGVKQAL